MMSKQVCLQWVGRETLEERRMERKRERSVGCRDEAELDLHMDKYRASKQPSGL